MLCKDGSKAEKYKIATTVYNSPKFISIHAFNGALLLPPPQKKMGGGSEAQFHGIKLSEIHFPKLRQFRLII